MGGPLAEAERQENWLEADLARNAGKRVFIFMHIPPFFVNENEPGLRSYNCLDETPRHWLLNLLRRYEVELLCSGHTHFAAYNRVNHTRLFIVPLTTTSRPGFNEVFTILPYHRGKNDLDKLGFYFARVCDEGVSMHLIRTNGERALMVEDFHRASRHTGGEPRLVTRLSSDLPGSPLGVNLRLPLAPTSSGVQAWPDAVRQSCATITPFWPVWSWACVTCACLLKTSMTWSSGTG